MIFKLLTTVMSILLSYLAAAIMLAVRGPDTPMLVIISVRLGVRRKGTGLLESSSPVTSSTSNLK